MKLLRFVSRSVVTPPRLGVLQASKVIDLAVAYRCAMLEANSCTSEAAHKLSELLMPGNMVEFLENGDLGMEAARLALSYAERFSGNSTPTGERFDFSQDEVRFLTPIHKPRNLRDFLSFEVHLKNARARRGEEVPALWYELPVYYKGSTSTIVGPDEEVVWPDYSSTMDYELEFACIIGKNGRDIKAEHAENYIFGYTIMNDFSARDMQYKEMSIGLGPAKGKDFATALGPYIVTKDELPDPYQLRMIARVNGEIWSDGSSSSIYRTFPEMIAYASIDEHIAAGDVFGSGTVGFGSGLELGKYLKDGDVVELEIEGLGRLANRVVRKNKP